MKIKVFVKPKKTVLDPQGNAIQQAVHSLGYTSVNNMRIGKIIEFEMQDAKKESIEALCQGLFSNPIIEDYTYEMLESA